nr:MAG TPA: hypothetical protein [Caudoviricetes sp.]
MLLVLLIKIKISRGHIAHFLFFFFVLNTSNLY